MKEFELYNGAYNPNSSEEVVLAYWQKSPFFKPEYNADEKKVDTLDELRAFLQENPDKKFVLIDPPPNAYGRPHLGNISGYSYQDLLGRFWRMNGKRVLLFPGKDHAGIQGEIVVLREHFKPKGITKQNISREDFYNQTYDYFVGMMAKARQDEQRIGLSADYDRDTFTLDPKIVDNILNTFVALYEKDMVYKGVRIVNWCPSCQTALADIDTQKKTRDSSMYYIKYPLKNAKGDVTHITVATTRPETMLGDTAVVVHPSDERYTHLIGETVILPLVNREIPIIVDPKIDKETGTGALKLTPAHSPEDYEIMLNWNKENPDNQVDYINVIDKFAKMVGPIGSYKGLTVEDARAQVVKDLQEKGLLEKEEKIEQRVPVCERCKTVVEPIMSSQWFIAISELRDKGIKVVEDGEINIHPKYMTKKYLHWMKNLRDWPISRSLWWGYRFPVWYKGNISETVDDNGKVSETIGGVAVTDFKDAVQKGVAKVSLTNPGEGWIQDDNVFDTWFSSGQWPYVTLEKENLLDVMYPTDVMETGYDILEFWVSRMIMLGIFRTGHIPFKDVYLHGLIKGEDGQKMSKSKGNIVELDDIVAEFGADALRMLYIVGNKAGASYRLDKEKLKGYRNFLNKMWNASKFVFNMTKDAENLHELDPKTLQFAEEDTLLLNHLNEITELVENKIKRFKFGLVAVDLNQSFWTIFCDSYLEKVKQRLYTKDREGNPINTSNEAKASRLAAQWTLWHALGVYLKLLHPYIPFITEYIWHSYPKAKNDSETIMYAKWPLKVEV